MINKILILLSIFFLLGCTNKSEEVLLFSYFHDNGSDGLHLAYSRDGFSWTPLKDDSSFLTPEVGEAKLMRDPCIIQGPDGLFHMVWTTGWWEKGIGYAYSSDLVTWSEQKYLEVMAHEPSTRNTWAPEVFYDEASERFMIYWSSTIPGKFLETDSTSESGLNHRIYYTLTSDFKDFTETKLLYDPGFSVIDATIQKVGGEYVMFVKNETRYPPKKDIFITRSQQLTGPYSAPSEPITISWVEGPTAIQLDGKWIVYYDEYREKKMGAVSSTDLIHWELASDSLRFPGVPRHGSVLRVEEALITNLIED